MKNCFSPLISEFGFGFGLWPVTLLMLLNQNTPILTRTVVKVAADLFLLRVLFIICLYAFLRLYIAIERWQCLQFWYTTCPYSYFAMQGGYDALVFFYSNIL